MLSAGVPSLCLRQIVLFVSNFMATHRGWSQGGHRHNYKPSGVISQACLPCSTSQPGIGVLSLAEAWLHPSFTGAFRRKRAL